MASGITLCQLVCCSGPVLSKAWWWKCRRAKQLMPGNQEGSEQRTAWAGRCCSWKPPSSGRPLTKLLVWMSNAAYSALSQSGHCSAVGPTIWSANVQCVNLSLGTHHMKPRWVMFRCGFLIQSNSLHVWKYFKSAYASGSSSLVNRCSACAIKRLCEL